ncbi:amidinotransferase [Streptomyces tateyamensis]|uniref:Amidinotransferase n=1 Tax=Streptomyces tateyamensis TaxID=565073 RepID=A0A2V4PPT6_9ACTN|nr:dimethylargininase [Streptomyces tateyamensis]PYC88405.1 amidinotransferase [Streptomyces tateyamensis]
MTRTPARTASRRHYLLCPPTHFAVRYAINPWMDPARRVDRAVAMTQWSGLSRTLRDLGHTVHTMEPLADLPDMVFAANGATVVDGDVLIARFRHHQRAPEARAHLRWFTGAGYHPVRRAGLPNEGEGDFLQAGGRILAGTGFRTSAAAHREAQQVLGRPVVTLTLSDPRFYHLDTALAVLTEDQIMYYPGAFAPASRQLLRTLFPDAIQATEADAAAFGLNAVSDGRHVVLPAAARALAVRLAARGFEPVPVELSELHKAGGGPKCCVLELRPGR